MNFVILFVRKLAVFEEKYKINNLIAQWFKL